MTRLIAVLVSFVLIACSDDSPGEERPAPDGALDIDQVGDARDLTDDRSTADSDTGGDPDATSDRDSGRDGPEPDVLDDPGAGDGDVPTRDPDAVGDPATEPGVDPDVDLPDLPRFGLLERPENPTCVAPSRPRGVHSIDLTRVYSGVSLATPVGLFQAPGDEDHWYAIEQAGRIRRFAIDPGTSERTTYADLSGRVHDEFNEQGLLGMAFHPNYASNRGVFVSYTHQSGGVTRSRISRFRANPDRETLDMSSEQVVLSIPQPDWNHNGGGIAFGPDGYLYIGMGDGGSWRDAYGHGQDTTTLLAAMLRIDIDSTTGYVVPDDNPFVGGGGRPEIFAYGLRNPWRFSFDRETGELWVGDVGQGDWEEIDVVTNGGNYGWPVHEGTDCPSWGDPGRCGESGLIMPVTQYSHSEGFSVTGGYVYRGEAMPDLYGDYIFGDLRATRRHTSR